MDFLELAEQRYSVRKFKDTPVEQEKIEKILKAGHLAPTARNNQPQRVLVIQTAEALAAFRKCTECHFNAPLAFIVCYDKEKCWKRSYDGKCSGEVDVGIVTTHMMLEATALGIGSTWVMYFMPDAVRQEFQLADNLEPMALLVMGYAAEDAAPSPRHTQYRESTEIIEYV